MSRASDAKQSALNEYDELKDSAIEFFLGYLDCSDANFKLESKCCAEEYIFGYVRTTNQENDNETINSED